MEGKLEAQPTSSSTSSTSPPSDPPIFSKLNPKTRGLLHQTLKAQQKEDSDKMAASEQTSVILQRLSIRFLLADNPPQLYCYQARWRPGTPKSRHPLYALGSTLKDKGSLGC